MDAAQREKAWRISAMIVAGLALLISALAFYGIKRLEAKSKPHVHQIREVHELRVEPHEAPKK